MSQRIYTDGILREEWDDPTRTYTAWDQNGIQTNTRPYTPEEVDNAEVSEVVDAQITNKSAIETNLEKDLATMQAIKDQTNAAIREDPSQEVKELAVAVRRLIKMALEDFSEAE